MNLYIITKSPFPIGMAATNRIICLAKAFRYAGVNCSVIIFRRKYTTNSIPGIGVFDGISYEYIGGSAKRASGKWTAKFQSFLQTIQLLLFLTTRIKSGDIVYDYFGKSNLLKSIMIWLVHKNEGFCVHELCEYPFGTGKETKKIAKQRKYALNHLFPQYDGIVAISETLVDLAKQYCSPKCVIQKVPILVDFEKYNLPDESSMAPIPYIFHSGTLFEQKDGILGMIEAFGIATNVLQFPVKFISTGKKEKSPFSNEIDNLIEKYNLKDKVVFTGYVSDEELKTYLRRASICVINKYPNQQNKYCFSTKLGEYMAAGKSIIITRVGEAINWLENDKDAVIVESQDSATLANALVRLFSNKAMRISLGNEARRKCFQAFDYHQYSKTLNHFVTRISSKDNK